MTTTTCPGCGASMEPGGSGGALTCPFCGHQRAGGTDPSATPFHPGSGAASAASVGPARDDIGLSPAGPPSTDDAPPAREPERAAPEPPPVSTADDLALSAADELTHATGATLAAGRRGFPWLIAGGIVAILLLVIGALSAIVVMLALG
jgi:hypothetical protein